MGYAFLYGVIGSLVGSNVGGEAYNAVLKPLLQRPDFNAAYGMLSPEIVSTLRSFWFVFAVLGVATMLLLIVYNKVFGEDTPTTRAKARVVMFFIYGLLIVLSGVMPWFVFRSKGFIPPKTWIQAVIMLAIGLGGLVTLLRRPPELEDVA